MDQNPIHGPRRFVFYQFLKEILIIGVFTFNSVEKRHFDKSLDRSAEYVFKPMLKIINKEFCEPSVKRGKKYLVPCYQEPKIYQKKLLGKNVTILEPRYKPLVKVVAQNETEEYHLDSYMNRKIRPNILITSGDKIFKNVECMPDFYKQGGLVYSSNFGKVREKTNGKKSDNFYDYLDLSMPTLDKDKLWTNKIDKEKISADQNYLLALDKWDEDVLQLNSNDKTKLGVGGAVNKLIQKK
jgi:hypothetical protein